MLEKHTDSEDLYALTLPTHDDGLHYAVDLALACYDIVEVSVTDLVSSMYGLSDYTCCGSEELLTVALEGGVGTITWIGSPPAFRGDGLCDRKPVAGGHLTHAKTLLE